MSEPDRPMPRSRKPVVRLHLACNDPDNGNWRGRTWMANLTAPTLDVDFETRSGREVRVCEHAGRSGHVGAIRLAGKLFAVEGVTRSYGNWCWDAWRISPATGAAFLLWVKRRGLFRAVGYSGHLDCGGYDVDEWLDGTGEVRAGISAAEWLAARLAMEAPDD